MNKPQEIANYIILKAYKNGGVVDFKDLNFENLNIEEDWELLSQVNNLLKVYGNLLNELSNETWCSYSLSAYGSEFAGKGAFRGFEQDIKVSRTAKKFSIIAVIIAFASLIVSIIAICK